MKIICPACKKETTWEENPWRPFCSERCKLIDLGKWVSEEYKIAGEKAESEEQRAEGNEQKVKGKEQRAEGNDTNEKKPKIRDPKS